MLSNSLRAFTAATFVLAARAATACPLCADNLADDVTGNQTSALGRGFFWSIILMITIQFALVAIVTYKIVQARKRASRNPSGLHAVPEASS
ncbi:MAG: hypothetical protein ACRD16_08580 [Thermoanaerobaculia bacterium]